MHFEKRTKQKDGSIYHVVVENYIDPLTNKRKRASITMDSFTPRAQAQARRELDDKISRLISQRQDTQKEVVENYTFGELVDEWFEAWSAAVKPQTVLREKLVITRVSELLDKDVLVKKITPLLIKRCMDDYKSKYQSTFSTMQHVKSTLNKIFDFAVLYNILPFSPARVVKIKSSVTEKTEQKVRLERKFLDGREVKTLVAELRKRRNASYLDLTLFLLGTGCRIGEAIALTADDIDFDKKVVIIKSSLRTQDLTIDEYYLDTTKTPTGERVEALPDFAINAVKRCIKRNELVDATHRESPSDVFRYSKSLFRTEYGSPITSHSFRQLLTRISKQLFKKCEKEYGFKWTKNAVPHSFRHVHISVLRDDPLITLKEVQERVGHLEAETTAIYTHRLTHSQSKSVEVIGKFASKIGVANG